MLAEFELLKASLREFAPGGCAYFLQPLGNLGDALIRAGTRKFLDDIGFQVIELPPEKSLSKWAYPMVRGGPLIFCGSGAWCHNYMAGSRMVGKLRRRFKVMVFPSTYEVGPFPDDVVFFARDNRESLEYCRAATFCHDLAFYLGQVRCGKGSGSLRAFRKDRERVYRTLPSDNIDISELGDQYSDVSLLFDRLAPFEKIETDRLHVAIAGALMGKKIELYGTNYFKSRAIFESTFVKYFPKITFHDL